MAIDDNANYTLTGAQVKDLAQRVKAGGGGGVLIGYINYTSSTVPSGNISVYTDTTYTTAISADDVAAALDNGDTVFFRFTDGWDEIKILSIAESEAMIGDDTIVYHFMASSSKDCIGQLQGHVNDWNVAFFLSTLKTVGNGTLTIQHNGTNVQTFTANQSTNATANIETIWADDIEATTPVPAVETAMIADGAVTGPKLDFTSAAGTSVIKTVSAPSGIRNAIYFADGTLITTRYWSSSVAVTSAIGSLYHASIPTGSDYIALTPAGADDFISQPVVTVSPSCYGGQYFWVGAYSNSVPVSNSSTGNRWSLPSGAVDILRATSNSAVSVGLNIVAIGRWKA